MTRSSVPATVLIAALLDRLGADSVVLTDEDLARVQGDQLDMTSHETDPMLRPGAYRLTVNTRARRRIVIPGSLVNPALPGAGR